MDSRDRVIRAVEFRGPDRVPNGCYALPGSYYRHGKKLEDLFLRFPSDFHQFVASWTMGAADSIPYKGGINEDPWGVVWNNPNPGIFGRIVEYPLADWKNLDNYSPPDLSELVNFDEIGKSIRLTGHNRYVLGDSENFFERLHWLHGYANTLFDLMTSRKELEKLIDILLDFKIRFIKRWLELDIDGVYFLDDWGTMQGLMISPNLWRQRFRPLYKRMFDVVHKSGKHVLFHSDGYVLDIIQDFIEIGVDALNIQVKLMGVDRLSEKFGGKLCILTDIDRQYILPFGTTKEVEEHIRHIIRVFALFDGGLISWGEIGPDVPLSNAETMLKTFARYGRYPLGKL